jgi:endonuclease YncB( thermonuclease family)
MQRFFLLTCLALLAGCAKPHPLDALEPGERGRVVRILDGDALVLDTGQSVRLASIEAPARPWKDREGEPFQDKSRRMLEDMALGREVQLFYAGLTRDKYDRALAQVRTTDALGPDLWLNAEMLRRGGARMRVYPDTAGGSETFSALEAEAREAKRGLWAMKVWRVSNAAALPDPFERFQLVSGRVSGMEGSESYGTSCDLSLDAGALHLDIANSAAAYCQLAEGTPVLARGYVKAGRMEVTHPLNLQTTGTP